MLIPEDTTNVKEFIRKCLLKGIKVQSRYTGVYLHINKDTKKTRIENSLNPSARWCAEINNKGKVTKKYFNLDKEKEAGEWYAKEKLKVKESLKY